MSLPPIRRPSRPAAAPSKTEAPSSAFDGLRPIRRASTAVPVPPSTALMGMRWPSPFVAEAIEKLAPLPPTTVDPAPEPRTMGPSEAQIRAEIGRLEPTEPLIKIDVGDVRPLGTSPILGANGMPLSCLSCTNFGPCRRPKTTICEEFVAQTVAVDLGMFGKKVDVAVPFAERAIARQEQTFGGGHMSDDQIFTLIDRVISATENSAFIDYKINDQDLPEAKNFFEFATTKSFLGVKPYAKQLEVGLNVFGEVCPHCSNPKWMRQYGVVDIPSDATYDQILDNVQLLHDGVCPKPGCGRNRLDLQAQYGMRFYNELIGVAGQRAGKSWLVALLSAYILHRYLKLQNPLRLFNIDVNGMLHATFTAVDLSQVRRSVFTPLYTMCSDSHWFTEYHKMLDYYQAQAGRELYHFKELSFGYAHRRLLAYPATPSKKNLRGATRFLGSIDELGWFFAAQKGAIKLDPDEVYAAMVNSFLTVRSAVSKLHKQGLFKIPPPLFANVTSPSNARDKAMRVLRDSEKVQNIYSFHYTSKEINPELDDDELKAIEATNPEAYKRDFLAQPPDAASAFLQNRTAVQKVARPRFKNRVRIEQSTAYTRLGAPMTRGEARIVGVPNDSASYVLALDAGAVDNSFACALVRLQEQEDGPTVVVAEALFETIPLVGYPINFNDIYERVISPLFDQFDIRYVTADRWNSKKILDDLEAEHGVKHSAYSLKYSDFVDFREAVYNGLVRVPRAEIDLDDAFKMGGTRDYPHNFTGSPVSHLQVQMLTVEDIMGKKVDKGERMTDDLFRALVLGYAIITDREVQDIYLAGEYDRSMRGVALGAVGSFGNVMSGVRGVDNTGTSGGIASMGSAGAGGFGGGRGGSAGVFSGNMSGKQRG